MKCLAVEGCHMPVEFNVFSFPLSHLFKPIIVVRTEGKCSADLGTF